MKKRLLCVILAVIVLLPTFQAAAFAMVTSLDSVKFTDYRNEEAGLNGDVNITFTGSGSAYSGNLYLPGNVSTEDLRLSWEDGMTAAENDHLCVECGQIAPNLVYVTATFVTGAGASEAPEPQTVISGEGKITKPLDPTRTGYIFDAWFVNGSEYDFDAVLNDNVTITAKWTEDEEQSDGSFMRIFHLDAGRKYFSADQIKNIIDMLAENNYTHLELALGNDALRFLLDDMTVVVNRKLYASEDVAAGISSGNRNYYNDSHGNYLTEREMDGIIAYAREKNVGIIPLINAPGHMDAIIDAMESVGIAQPAYNGSARTVDVTNEEAVNFTLALVNKYVRYFASKGAKIFNMGCDEYANDRYSSGSMGFGNLISSGKYGSFVSFVNSMAAQIKKVGMKPMAFNDGIYFGNNKSFGRFDTSILIAYWTSGWTNYNVRSAAALSSDGFKIVNTNDGWYYVLGRKTGGYSLQSAKTAAANTGVLSVSGSTSVTPIGSMMCVWCDTPSAGYSAAEVRNLEDLIETQSANNAAYFTQATKSIWGAEKDLKQSYATATFVTGEGASAAPEPQTVISGEGTIEKPDDPTRVGYIFAGWYVDSSEFDFTAFLTSDVTITAKWTECVEHEFENGICVKCGADEPNPEDECTTEKSASLADGKLVLTLGGHRVGEYTFAKSGSGWTIRDTDGKYLAISNNALTRSNSAFVWTYSNNRFSAAVGSSWSPWGGSTTYYLVCAGGKLAVSTSATGATAAFTAKVVEHTPEPADAVEATCTEAGHTEGTVCAVCGTVLTGCDQIVPLGHDIVSHEAQKATCEEVGWEAYEACSRCEYTTYVEIPATGHTEIVDPIVLPTDTTDGLTAGSHCSVCEKVLVEQKPFKSLVTLPNGLLGIEDEAFLNSGAECVILPDTCEKIGSKAFAACELLKLIEIPTGVADIAVDAFEESPDVVILTTAGSPAETFAEHNGMQVLFLP